METSLESYVAVGNIESALTDVTAHKSSSPFHHGDLAKALLDSAAGLIAERGTTEFSLREVAQKVGVSHTAAYRHFRSKAQLLLAIAIPGFRDLSKTVLQASADAPAGTDRLISMGRAYVGFAVAQPGAYRTMFHPSLCTDGGDAELHTASAQALGLLCACVAEGQKAGRLRADLDPAIVATALWAGLHGYAGLLIDQMLTETDDGPPAPRTNRDIFLNLMVEALRQR